MDIALKQRLVGASVLIALAVIVLPMLLGGRPDGQVAQSQQIEIPRQPEELDFETRRYPIGEAPVPSRQNEEAAPARPLPSPPQQEPAEQLKQAEAVVDTVESPQALPQVEIDEPEVREHGVPAAVNIPDNSGRYVVQVASFGSLANANRLSDVLGGFGYPVIMDSIKSEVGTLHRVRVGPYSSESAASEAVAKIKSQVADLKPRIMDLQPEKAAEVSSVSDPLVRWVVQVGSFSSAANADKLVERLKKESMAAYKEEVNGANGRIYRVRVGPFLERQEAIRIDQLIAERFKLDGVVMSAN